MIYKTLFLLFLFALMPQPAFAHSAAGGGFFAGLLHPVLGLDHLLAMVGVGVISTQIGGRAIWTVPGAFVFVMALGGIFGINSYDLLGFELAMIVVELGIIASVMVVGLVIAIDKNMPEILAMLCVGFFAFFHGYAHGAEFPSFNVQWPYIFGFMGGTAALHIAGVGIGFVAERVPQGPHLLRHSGSVMIGIGVFMFKDYLEYNLVWG